MTDARSNGGTGSRTPSNLTLLAWLVAAPLTALTASSVHAQTGMGGADGSVQRCDQSLGTVAITEIGSDYLNILSRYRLASPTMLLRVFAHESGCFTVVERDSPGFKAIRDERALAGGGELQNGSNLGKGQMQVADFVMTPTVQISDDTGGMSGHIGGLLAKVPGLGKISSVFAGVKFREAETSITVADVRSGIQVASAEGSASKMSFDVTVFGNIGRNWGDVGGYTKSPEGKVIAAGLLDNFNRVVTTLRGKTTLVQTHSNASRINAAASLPANMPASTQPSTMPPPPPTAALPVPMPNAGVVPAMAPGKAELYRGQLHNSSTLQEDGQFRLTRAPDGQLMGTVYLNALQRNVPVEGMLMPNGQMQLQGTTQQYRLFLSGMMGGASATQPVYILGQWTLRSDDTKVSMAGQFRGSVE